ncbi:sugar transferase [Albidovulum sp.]
MTPGKRLLDLVLVLSLLPLAAPLAALVALAVLVFDGRPVLHGSVRMRDGERRFTLWKFRTMTPAAVGGGAEAGVTGGDKAARITPLGRWLRRLRLDELPQILNILAGDMSLVGPRPPLPEYVARFPDLYREVLRCRPGLTGLATLVFRRREEQLLARCADAAETDRVYCRRCIPVKARLDLIYARRRSPCMDLAILWRTVKQLFTSFGK